MRQARSHDPRTWRASLREKEKELDRSASALDVHTDIPFREVLRIFARVLSYMRLFDARILILDEPTSALDPETEAYFVNALHEAAKDKLVIIIAHRLSTIANADRIYFLEDGEIREEGTHEELMAVPDGHYRSYASLQAGAG